MEMRADLNVELKKTGREGSIPETSDIQRDLGYTSDPVQE